MKNNKANLRKHCLNNLKIHIVRMKGKYLNHFKKSNGMKSGVGITSHRCTEHM